MVDTAKTQEELDAEAAAADAQDTGSDDPNAAAMEELRQKAAAYEKQLLDPEYLAYVAKKRGITEEEVQDEADELANVDLEKMTNTELAKFIATHIGKQVQKIVAPISSETAAAEARRQVDGAASKYKDFWDYKDDMIKIAAQYPKISAEDAYHLAKSRKGVAAPPAAPKKTVAKTAVPGAASAGTRAEKAKSVGEAAGKAFDTIFKD